MKKNRIYKKIIPFSIFSFLLSLISCIKILDEEDFAYYRFEPEDIDKVLIFEDNDFFKFQNESGNQIKYKAHNILDISKFSTLGWVESTENLTPPIPFPENHVFYHDTQISSFLGIDTKLKLAPVIKFRYCRFPKDVYQAQKNVHIVYPSEFIGQIYFSKWNALDNTRIICIDYNASTTSMIINGETYDKVYTIESDNPNILTCGLDVRDVNKIFYDLHKGIIGYDEIDGSKWRLINL